MRITVSNDDGTELFAYDTDLNANYVVPEENDRAAIIEALEDALTTLRGPDEPDEPDEPA